MSLVLLMEGGGNEESGKRKPKRREREPPDLPAGALESRLPVPPQMVEWNPTDAGYPSSLSFEGPGSASLPVGEVFHRDEGMIMGLERAQAAFLGYHPSTERDRSRSEEVARYHFRESHSEETEEDRKSMTRRFLEHPEPSFPSLHEDPYFTSPYASYPPPYAALFPSERYTPPYRGHHEFYPYFAQPHSYPPGMAINEPLGPTETLDVPDFPISSPDTLPAPRVPSYEIGYGVSSASLTAPSVAVAREGVAPAPEEPVELSEERLYPSDAELAGAKHERDRKAIVKWYERFRELIDFKNETGHCSVPQKYSKNKQLGSWVSGEERIHF